MAIDITSNRFFYFRAKFVFGLWNGNTEPTEFFGPANFTKMEITAPKQKFTRVLSNIMGGGFGNLMDAQPAVTDPATMVCEFDSMTNGMLNMLIGAHTAVLDQTGAKKGGSSGEAVARTPVVGIWQRFANQYLMADDSAGADLTPIVFMDAGTPAGSGGTPAAIPPAAIDIKHFEIDIVSGMWRPITSTGATAATVTYYTATRSGEIYNAGVITNQCVMLRGTAIEMSSNRNVAFEIHKAQLIPNGKIDLVGNNYLKGALDGDLLLPNGYASAWQMAYTDQPAS